jgi:hypothetical protein
VKLRNRVLIGLGAVAVAFAVTAFLIVDTQRRYSIEQLDRQLQSAIPLAFSQFGPRPQPIPTAPARSANCSWVGSPRTAR